MLVIPEGATHIWTPAIDSPTFGSVYLHINRRGFYKKVKREWWVYSNTLKEWFVSRNDPDWFATEKKEGYFVTIAKYQKPGFVAKKEVV